MNQHIISPNKSKNRTDARGHLIDTSTEIPYWVEVDEFNSSYYSGIDMSVYFEEIFIDEVIALQFSVQEMVMPYVGYASYTFDKVARGARQIQGSFTINFRERAYIPTMLRQLKNLEISPDPVLNKGNPNAISEIRRDIKNDLTLDMFVAKREKYDFGDIAEAYKRNLWGENYSNNPAKGFVQNLVRDNGSRQPLFDSSSNGFDILLKWGQPEEVDRSNDRTWGTLEKLISCHITGMGKEIDDSGRPILESYSFLARSWE
jgi:hypothetical protein